MSRTFLQRPVLGGILAQFPFSFTQHAVNRDYLIALKHKIASAIPFLVEFRHHSWIHPEVRSFLKEHDLNFVNVDEPPLRGLMPGTDWVTGETGYIRFHGRNRESWFKKDAEPWERYNYLYAISELAEWIPKVWAIARQTQAMYIFFNNHWQSQAAINARQMAGLLDTTLPGDVVTPIGVK